MNSQLWLSLFFSSSFSLINLVAVIKKFKINLEPVQIRVARVILFILLIIFSVILVKVIRITWKMDFPLQSVSRLENGKIYQLAYGMISLMSTVVLTLNVFTLGFIHCCYYIWQVWKNKITVQVIEFRFSNFKVTMYSLGLSCLNRVICREREFKPLVSKRVY